MAKLDKLVAEKVMGWEPDDPPTFCPSTDANAMMEVVKRMKELGYLWSVEDVKNGCVANFVLGEWKWRTACVHSSPLVATCLAALIALGVSDFEIHQAMEDE